jgi:hypothetical protein
MALDAQMTKLRHNLAKYEVEPPVGFERFLPRQDGNSGKCYLEAERVVLALKQAKFPWGFGGG